MPVTLVCFADSAGCVVLMIPSCALGWAALELFSQATAIRLLDANEMILFPLFESPDTLSHQRVENDRMGFVATLWPLPSRSRAPRISLPSMRLRVPAKCLPLLVYRLYIQNL